MNEALLKSLEELAKQATALETETKTAVANLDGKVNSSRREKEQKIGNFLNGMLTILATVDYPHTKRVDVLCCGDNWEGAPGACGSHRRNNGVSICRRKVHFGRYFSGSDEIDRVIYYNPERNGIDPFCDQSSMAGRFRNEIVDRWNDDTERAIEKAVADAAKAYIAERTKKATENLRAANERYENYLGESKEG